MAEILKIVNLNKKFGNLEVLKDVNLSLNEGEILSVLGDSGCGKSTLLRIIAGLETPSGGQIAVKDGCGTAMMFQSYALFPHLSVCKNVEFALWRLPSAERAQRSAQLLEKFKIAELKDKTPDQISGGQAQRTAFARAVANREKLLSLDEPFANLDRNLKSTLRGELNATRFAAEANAASALNSYIDAVYDEGARLSAQKMADFNYSFLSDYLVLWHGVWDDDAGAYLNEKFALFVSESFPKDFGENIAKIAAANVKNYESSLNFALKKYGAKVDLNVTQSFSLKSKAYRASGTGLGALGGVLGAKLISKSLAKTAAKTGAKTLTKAGASATSGSVGLVCGPGAVVCVPAFAVATWFGLDFAFAKGDEALNREEFEAAIVRDMMAAKEELKRALAEDFNATIDEISSEILNLDGK